MSLIRKFKKCIGIEYLENLTVLSKRFEENYNKKILEVIEDENSSQYQLLKIIMDNLSKII